MQKILGFTTVSAIKSFSVLAFVVWLYFRLSRLYTDQVWSSVLECVCS